MREQQVSKVDTKQYARFHWRQFSIRSLLVVAAIVAVTVGSWMHSVRRQRAAVFVLRLGGSVQYEDGFVGRWLPASIRNQFSDDAISNVTSVEIHYRTIDRRMVTPSTDELERAIAAISQLPQAQRLTLHTLKLQDDDLSRLDPLKHQITALSINELFHHELTGSGLQHLQGWPELRSLHFLTSSTEITGRLDIQSLATNPLLERLTIGTGTLEQRSFEELATIQSLKTLWLFNCRFEGQHLKHLQALPNLETIMLHNVHPEVSDFSPDPNISSESAEDSKPLFRYEQTPDWGMPLPRKGFPAEKYKQWLRNILPGVQVHEFFES